MSKAIKPINPKKSKAFKKFHKEMERQRFRKRYVVRMELAPKWGVILMILSLLYALAEIFGKP